MTECVMCGIDLDVEGCFTKQLLDGEITFELCGHCSDMVRKFIERGF